MGKPAHPVWSFWLPLGGLLLCGALVHLPTLGHPYLPGWDEAVHAAVAGNLARHPLTPTLLEDPLLPVDYRNWQANHVWLHMPPLPFWQAALSLGTLGRSEFALRLPSLLLFLLTLLLVGVLGRRLISPRAGLLAAALLLCAPFVWLLVQGYAFGDLTDIALGFWLLLCFFAIERALAGEGWRKFALAGLCQGLAVLAKSALALAPLGALFLVWLLPRLRFRLDRRVPTSGLLAYLACAIILPLAWSLYTRLRWPLEAAFEFQAVLAHVTSSYEGHGQPWDALFNSLLGNLFLPLFILPALAGTALLSVRALSQRTARQLLLPLWILGTLLPLVLVQTKVPAVLFGAAPALALATGALLCEGIRRAPRLLPLAVLAGSLAWFFLAERLAGAFEFLAPVAADWARDPSLPGQAALFGAFAGAFWLARRLARAWPALAKGALGDGRAAGGIGSLLVLGMFLVALDEHARTRMGFAAIADYNPVRATARSIAGEPAAAVLIEGTGNGRQRPDLALTFLLGASAQLVSARELPRAARLAEPRGPALLLSPFRRRAPEVAPPAPGSGWFVYRLSDGQPPPLALEPEAPPARSRLLSCAIEPVRVSRGAALQGLLRWRLGEDARSVRVRATFTPAGGGEAELPFPRPQHFPRAGLGTTLHKLAPSGLLWGERPLGTDLVEWSELQAGRELADGFAVFVPRHLAPGRYRLKLDAVDGGRERPVQGAGACPPFEVE